MIECFKAWITTGKVLITLVESLLVAIFLGLLAPLITIFQKAQSERQESEDLERYINLTNLILGDGKDSALVETFIQNTPSLSRFSEMADALKATDSAEKKLAALAKVRKPPRPFDRWDAVWSLFLPVVSSLLMLVAGVLDGTLIPPIVCIVAALVPSFYLGKRASQWTPSELIQHFCQFSFSFFFSLAAGIVFLLWI